MRTRLYICMLCAAPPVLAQFEALELECMRNHAVTCTLRDINLVLVAGASDHTSRIFN